MLVSLNWSKDFVKLPEDMDLKQLAYDLTMSTVEVEDVEVLAERFEGLVVGEIKEVLPHPNADKLRVCKVDIGAAEIKDIVLLRLQLRSWTEGLRCGTWRYGKVARRRRTRRNQSFQAERRRKLWYDLCVHRSRLRRITAMRRT